MSNPNTFEALIEQLDKEADWMTPDEGYQGGRIGQIKLCITQFKALAPHYIHKDKVRELQDRLLEFARQSGNKDWADGIERCAQELTTLLGKEGE